VRIVHFTKKKNPALHFYLHIFFFALALLNVIAKITVSNRFPKQCNIFNDISVSLNGLF